MNDNHISTEENTEILERLRYTHDLVIEWIKAADSRSQAVVSLAGAMVGVLAFLKPEGAGGNSKLFVLTSLACVALSAVGWLFSVFSFFPRVKSLAPQSMLFFGDIAAQIPLRSVKVDPSVEYVQGLTSKSFTSDLASQIVVNSHICRQKYIWVSRALNTVLVAMAFFFAAIVVRLQS
jgi:hypothetical protein